MNETQFEGMQSVVIDTLHSEKILIKQIPIPRKNIVYDTLKRIFDIVASFIITLIIIVPCIIIGIAVKIDSKGPTIYRQKRLGHFGKTFCVYKFRSMYQDAEIDGKRWATPDDERCTKVGRFLRRFRLDELPQIPFNILRGNMSFVGPRPERKYFYDEFSRYMTGFEQRLYVKPGLTGLAQINGGYSLKPEEKIIYDLEYIENRSVLTDLIIMMKTIVVVFTQRDV